MPTMGPASEYIPRVTKSLVRGPEPEPKPDYPKVNSFHFDDSDTLICAINGFLHISFNNGESWQVADAFQAQLIRFVGGDLFHKGRAFVTSEGGKIHVTEDRGRNWKRLHVPEVTNEHVECRGIEIHPIDKRLLLFHISIRPGREIIYASCDAGESFRRITPPVGFDDTSSTYEQCDCRFAVSSTVSTFENNGIYYIHKLMYGKKSSATHDIELQEKHNRSKSTLFYTADFGKTTRSFDELNDCWIKEMFIFSSSIIVLTSDNPSHAINKLWVSKGGSFESIHIPDEVAFFTCAFLLPLGQDFTSRYDQKRLLLEARINGCKGRNLLELDLSNLNFSKNPVPSYDEAFETYLSRLHNLKESYRGKLYPKPYAKRRKYYKTEIAHFNDSEILIFILDGSLHISFNSGESWQSIDGFKEVESVDLDEFHNERAFVTSEGGRLHVTEDQGRSWNELVAPDEYTANSKIYTHPVDKKLLLFRVYTEADNIFYFCFPNNFDIIYASNDAGQSYRRIAPSVNYPWTTPNFERYRCYFAVCSKESTLDNNGIYYIREATYAEEPELDSDNLTDELESAEVVHTLFYTADFGETTKTFNELNGLIIIEIFIFPSSIFVLTSEGNWSEQIRKLWVSKGEHFEPVCLPDEVSSLDQAWCCSQDNRKVLLLIVSVNDSKDPSVSQSCLILDPQTLGFSWSAASRPLSRTWSPGLHADIEQLKNLKGTLWKTIYVNTELGERKSCMTKASFDNGKSWTNPRVVDPTGKHKHLFEGDINDVERCSFQDSGKTLSYYATPSNEHINDVEICSFQDSSSTLSYHATHPNELTAGIILKIGTAGTNPTRSSRHDITFISRDGGVSWEVAFEFPVHVVPLDFGNIIVAIPRNRQICKFYFSLDQGRTWNEYDLDEPIFHERYFCIDKLGLKLLLKSRKEKKSTEAYVFYSIDFSNIFGGTACTEEDLERWYLSNGNCIDGVRYYFKRRKPDAKCLVKKTFKNLELHEERCEC